MKTAQQLEEAFRKDLAELLERHKAEFEVTDDGKDWGLHTGVCRITIMGTWDSEGRELSEFTMFNL